MMCSKQLERNTSSAHVLGHAVLGLDLGWRVGNCEAQSLKQLRLKVPDTWVDLPVGKAKKTKETEHGGKVGSLGNGRKIIDLPFRAGWRGLGGDVLFLPW